VCFSLSMLVVCHTNPGTRVSLHLMPNVCRPVTYGYDRVDIKMNHFLGFTGGWVDFFAIVAEIITICGFNHTVNNMASC